jgi:hypothetical protein
MVTLLSTATFVLILLLFTTITFFKKKTLEAERSSSKEFDFNKNLNCVFQVFLTELSCSNLI